MPCRSSLKQSELTAVCQVALPSTLHGVTHENPKIRALHEKLADVTRRIASNDLQIPPERERSPSPTPIYDRMGQRLNTREVSMHAWTTAVGACGGMVCICSWLCSSGLHGL